MLGQQYAERPTETVTPPGRTLPHWNIALRRFVAVVLERTLGECWAPNPRVGLLVLLVIVGLLAIIAVTLSVGNALLVLLAAVVMRISCERRRPARR
ncbi:MAG TPA: hypothetical protein VHF06_04315 [Pseudonocardiaceae bacterium]|jgi:hypothetical protein|nr:hypothetical protein [Pseudonocardiaceae bacterium]